MWHLGANQLKEFDLLWNGQAPVFPQTQNNHYQSLDDRSQEEACPHQKMITTPGWQALGLSINHGLLKKKCEQYIFTATTRIKCMILLLKTFKCHQYQDENQTPQNDLQGSGNESSCFPIHQVSHHFLHITQSPPYKTTHSPSKLSMASIASSFLYMAFSLK